MIIWLLKSSPFAHWYAASSHSQLFLIISFGNRYISSLIHLVLNIILIFWANQVPWLLQKTFFRCVWRKIFSRKNLLIFWSWKSPSRNRVIHAHFLSQFCLFLVAKCTIFRAKLRAILRLLSLTGPIWGGGSFTKIGASCRKGIQSFYGYMTPYVSIRMYP